VGRRPAKQRPHAVGVRAPPAHRSASCAAAPARRRRNAWRSPPGQPQAGLLSRRRTVPSFARRDAGPLPDESTVSPRSLLILGSCVAAPCAAAAQPCSRPGRTVPLSPSSSCSARRFRGIGGTAAERPGHLHLRRRSSRILPAATIHGAWFASCIPFRIGPGPSSILEILPSPPVLSSARCHLSLSLPLHHLPPHHREQPSRPLPVESLEASSGHSTASSP
jgi:hypothetical protein